MLPILFLIDWAYCVVDHSTCAYFETRSVNAHGRRLRSRLRVSALPKSEAGDRNSEDGCVSNASIHGVAANGGYQPNS